MVVNLIDRVKHSFSKDKKLSSALYGILGFYPHNLEFYRAALAHKSQSYRNRAGKPVNNERLEYLGDAILEAVVSDIVYHRYPRKREGFLTSTRSKIVQRSSLNKLSADLGLDRLIKTTAQPGPRSNNIGGNAFEALMGAVYLDRGYHHCQWFIEKRIIGRLLDIDGVANKEVNFKSKLLEWTQKNRILAEYKLEEKADENNGTQLFHSSVVLEGIVAGTGLDVVHHYRNRALAVGIVGRLFQAGERVGVQGNRGRLRSSRRFRSGGGGCFRGGGRAAGSEQARCQGQHQQQRNYTPQENTFFQNVVLERLMRAGKSAPPYEKYCSIKSRYGKDENDKKVSNSGVNCENN